MAGSRATPIDFFLVFYSQNILSDRVQRVGGGGGGGSFGDVGVQVVEARDYAVQSLKEMWTKLDWNVETSNQASNCATGLRAVKVFPRPSSALTDTTTEIAAAIDAIIEKLHDQEDILFGIGVSLKTLFCLQEEDDAPEDSDEDHSDSDSSDNCKMCCYYNFTYLFARSNEEQ